MANTFNSISKGVIFQDLRVVGGEIIQLIPFIRAFYAFETPLFYTHHNHEDDVTIIPSTIRTCQGDPLREALFALAQFTALCSITNHFLSCIFPSIVNDTHIIGLLSTVSSTYEHFQTKFCVIGPFYPTLEMHNMVTL
jgi:hypothetical protein